MVQLHDWRWMLAVWAVGSVRTIDLNSYKVAFKYGGLRVAKLIQWYVAYPRAGFTRESSRSRVFFFFFPDEVTLYNFHYALLVEAVTSTPRFKKREYTLCLLLEGI